jgi:hypothetical protein
MTGPTTDIDGWITESTRYIIHLNSTILYKEQPTVEVPLVEIIEISEEWITAKTPVDVGEDTSPVNEEGGVRAYKTENVNQIIFLEE